ncbi:MAG: hypothetical protein IPJ01_12260 [Micavibrio sp.]|nr:hypothetical protein [Micavibrio sp.]
MDTTQKSATIQDAIDAGACYDADELKQIFGRRKSLTVKQIVALKIPDEDKVWALTQFHFLDTKEKSVRFAIFCAEQCLTDFEKWDANDKCPREAIEAAKNWLINPTDSAARSADSAARSAARSAYSAARSAARSAYSAARSADSAARSAAYSAYSAARSAAYSAAHSAADSAADSAQVKFLVKLITGET